MFGLFKRRKTTPRAIKLLLEHGYGVAEAQISELITDEGEYQGARVFYILVRRGVVFGLVPMNVHDTVEIIPMNSDTMFLGIKPKKADYADLEDKLATYGYKLSMPENIDTTPAKLVPIDGGPKK